MKEVDHICGDHWEHFRQRQESLELEQSSVSLWNRKKPNCWSLESEGTMQRQGQRDRGETSDVGFKSWWAALTYFLRKVKWEITEGFSRRITWSHLYFQKIIEAVFAEARKRQGWMQEDLLEATASSRSSRGNIVVWATGWQWAHRDMDELEIHDEGRSNKTLW